MDAESASSAAGDQGVIFVPRRPRWMKGLFDKLNFGKFTIWIDDGARSHTKWSPLTLPTKPGACTMHVSCGMTLAAYGYRDVALVVREHEWATVYAVPGLMRSPRVWTMPS